MEISYYYYYTVTTSWRRRRSTLTDDVIKYVFYVLYVIGRVWKNVRLTVVCHENTTFSKRRVVVQVVIS